MYFALIAYIIIGGLLILIGLMIGISKAKIDTYSKDKYAKKKKKQKNKKD